MIPKKQKKSSSGNKILKYSLSILLVLILAMSAIPLLFKDKILALVSDTINNKINATVSFKELDLSFFRNFPYASLRVNELAIINKAPFLRDTLFHAEKINFTIKITSLFYYKTAPIAIDRISATNGTLNIIFDKNNSANFDIAKKNNSVTTETESAVALLINEYALENINFSFSDETSKVKLALNNIYHSGKGNFTKEILDIDTKTTAKLSLDYQNINYLKDINIKLNAALNIDLQNSKFTFKENTASINKLPLEFNGFIQLTEEGQFYDMAFYTPNSSFKNLLALLPKQYSKDLNGIETKGNFDLNGVVKGSFTETTIPALNISFVSKNAMFKYTSLPKSVNNINIDASIINTSGYLKDTKIAITNTSFKLDKDLFSASGNVVNLLENATVNLKVKGSIDLGTIKKVYPITFKNELKGILQADITTQFDLKSIEKETYQHIKNKGNITVSNFKFKAEDIANPFFIDKTSVSFTTNTVILEEFRAKTGASDIAIQGNLENFYGFLYKDEKLKGNFNLNSTVFKVSDFLTQSKTTNTKEKETINLKIPSFLDVRLEAVAKKVIYDNINLTSVSGELHIKEESVRLKNITSAVFGGNIDFDGVVSTAEKRSKFALDLNLKKLNIADSFNHLKMLEAIAPITETVEGKINATLQVSGDLNGDITPNLKSIFGSLRGQLSNTKLKPKNSKALNLLGSKIDFLDLNEFNLNDVSASFSFANGQVRVPPININYKDIAIKIEGSHGFNTAMNYDINLDVPVKYLGSTVTTALTQCTPKDVARIKSIPIKASLKGSFSTPIFSSNIKNTTADLLKILLEKQKQSVLKTGKDKLKNLLFNSIKTNNTKNKIKNVLGGFFGKIKDTVKKN
ncbi:outer membrane assembly protein [Polaribacter irgensii 23-P]|uniref:Outer membrane assembly protein n=1 Tax=Polaribacter irgensii 23-P TaxID=313594 RepID=A4C0T1_9FLAO|nr:AsmA-like C-terminal region-containing protein [Polaribacter irgensii]EAR13024.1 outer membrane assembly protein [Polaribacter irgensii 23-P]